MSIEVFFGLVTFRINRNSRKLLVSTMISARNTPSTTKSRTIWHPCNGNKRMFILVLLHYDKPANKLVNRGNLSTKSLASVVDPRSIVQDSEYIETHLVAVPGTQVKDFLKEYETVSPMVVPRSANLVASDDDFTLYAVTTFKKHSAEFIHKCRENKWIPRDFKYVEGGKEEEKKEVERVSNDAHKLWGETLRLGRTAWSEAVMVWIHILVLRVFVETVLRYGLPLDFVCTIIRVCYSIHSPPMLCY